MAVTTSTSTSTSTFLCSSIQRKSIHFTFSPSAILSLQTPKPRLPTSFAQLGIGLFPQWSGLRPLDISIKHKFIKIERRGRCKGKGVYASLFGVGAPEALVIGVVALLVFGPKGLAEVARNLGQTLRAFQPTIRELQEVSRDFKSTLEREIGLDDNPPSVQNTSISPPTPTSTSAVEDDAQAALDPNGTLSKSSPYTSEEYLKVTEEQLKSYGLQPNTPPQEQQLKQLELQDPEGVSPSTKEQDLTQVVVEAQLKSSASEQQKQSIVSQEAQSQPQSESQQEIAPSTPQPKRES